MALLVQQQLELMAPELNDYRDKRIFSEHEIRTIIDRRSYHELSMRKRPPTKGDFLHAIRYELNLDESRQSRKKDLSLHVCPSDFAITQRIFSLFHRATLRFSGDQTLWEAYISYCLRKGAFKRISYVFGKALALHPHSLSLWLLAAQFELTVQHSPTAARAIYKNALLSNPLSTVLYEEWLKMEIFLLRSLKESGRLHGLGSSEHLLEKTQGTDALFVINQSFNNELFSQSRLDDVIQHHCTMVRLFEIGVVEGFIINQEALNNLYEKLAEFYLENSRIYHSPRFAFGYSTVLCFLTQRHLRVQSGSLNQKMIDCLSEMTERSKSHVSTAPLIFNLVLQEMAALCVKFNHPGIDNCIILIENLIEAHKEMIDDESVKSLIVLFSQIGRPVVQVLEFLCTLVNQITQSDLIDYVALTSLKLLAKGIVFDKAAEFMSKNSIKISQYRSIMSVLTSINPPIYQSNSIWDRCLIALSSQNQHDIDLLRQEFERLLVTSHDVDLWTCWVRFEQLLDPNISRANFVVKKAIQRVPSLPKFLENIL
ncbi:hypothetical protein RCL1_000601 [Eukaryota sp. TZLM3-RCL]